MHISNIFSKPIAYTRTEVKGLNQTLADFIRNVSSKLALFNILWYY